MKVKKAEESIPSCPFCKGSGAVRVLTSALAVRYQLLTDGTLRPIAGDYKVVECWECNGSGYERVDG